MVDISNFNTLKEVPGSNGKYFISIDTKEGVCVSFDWEGHKGKIGLMSNKPRRRDSRIYWSMKIGEKVYCYQAAKWIAITYPELIENEYFDGAEIDHINTDPMDNRPENLRWVTRKENLNNPLTRKHRSASITGKKANEETKRKMSKARKGLFLNRPDQSKAVVQYTINGEYVAQYPSTSEAERQTGIKKCNIQLCCKGKQKTTGRGKYIFRYIS